MRVVNQTLSDSIIQQLQKLSSRQVQLQNQVSTGQRIFQPEDDPAAVGRLLAVQTDTKQVQQFSNNASRALQISQATYAGLQAVKKVSDRAGELATLGSGAISPDSSNAYATEVDQLIEQATQGANSKLGNDYLFGGQKVDTPPFTIHRDTNGSITSIDYNGDAATSSIQLSSTSSIKPGTDGTTNQQIADFLNNLVTLRDALRSGNTAAVSAVRPNLDDSENNLINTMSEQGALQTRIESAQDDQAKRFQDLQKLASAETDADLPSTVVKLTQTQTAYQAAMQSAASIMKLSLLDYLR